MVTVTVYTTGTACVQCTMTHRRLDEAGIPHTSVDLSDPANAAARDYVTDDLGYTRAPVVVVDGDPEHHWSRFDPDKINVLARAAERDARPRAKSAIAEKPNR